MTIYATFTITIKDFKLRLNKKNFPKKVYIIWFEPFAQKSEINKLFDLFFFLYSIMYFKY